MRRGFSALLFFVAACLLAIAGGGWLLQRIAFQPASSEAVAREVLTDPEVREAVATVVAGAAAEALGIPENQLAVSNDTIMQNPAAATFLAEIVADAHARVIGSGGPVQITGAQMVDIVRDQRAAALPAVTLPVEEVSILSTIRTALSWVVPIAAIAGLAAAVVGILAHPERADVVWGLGVLLIFGAVLVMLLGYVVPAFALPALNDDPWLAAISAAANEQLALVGGLAVALAVVGVVLIIGGGTFRRRKTGWSAPVRTARYSEQRRWS